MKELLEVPKKRLRTLQKELSLLQFQVPESFFWAAVISWLFWFFYLRSKKTFESRLKWYHTWSWYFVTKTSMYSVKRMLCSSTKLERKVERISKHFFSTFQRTNMMITLKFIILSEIWKSRAFLSCNVATQNSWKNHALESCSYISFHLESRGPTQNL